MRDSWHHFVVSRGRHSQRCGAYSFQSDNLRRIHIDNFPTAAHAIAKGAYASGVKLWEKSVVDKYGADKED
jgi:hypothetical protein